MSGSSYDFASGNGCSVNHQPTVYPLRGRGPGARDRRGPVRRGQEEPRRDGCGRPRERHGAPWKRPRPAPLTHPCEGRDARTGSLPPTSPNQIPGSVLRDHLDRLEAEAQRVGFGKAPAPGSPHGQVAVLQRDDLPVRRKRSSPSPSFWEQRREKRRFPTMPEQSSVRSGMPSLLVSRSMSASKTSDDDKREALRRTAVHLAALPRGRSVSRFSREGAP